MWRSEEFYKQRIPEGTDKRVAAAIRRIYNVYPDDCLPLGLADPMYIMNVIAVELGIGDGEGNFNLPETA